MVVCCHQKAGKNHNLLIANKFFKSVMNFICLGLTVTKQNCLHEEINSKLISGTACCVCVLPFSKNFNIKIYKNIIFPVVLYGC
jgi:hypothetical protein